MDIGNVIRPAVCERDDMVITLPCFGRQDSVDGLFASTAFTSIAEIDGVTNVARYRHTAECSSLGEPFVFISDIFTEIRNVIRDDGVEARQQADIAKDDVKHFRAMFYVEDYSDERLESWCIHCGVANADVKANRDHVPTKSFLSKRLREDGAACDLGQGAPDGYLPQVLVCEACNTGFSRDEAYLLCVLHAILAGSLYPDPDTHAEAANVLRSNRDVVRSLKAGLDGQMLLFAHLEPFTLYPDPDRVRSVVLKNARGHAYHEIGEPRLDEPSSISFQPLPLMTDEERAALENGGDGGLGLR